MGRYEGMLRGALALDVKSAAAVVRIAPVWTQSRTKNRMGSMDYFTETMTIFIFLQSVNLTSEKLHV
ncbi:hypothetical protein CRX69_15005 [Pseudomonas rhizophila]|uniref:Uncharacterized protein n=1 Tax=Pseudomonas rhizophila TaxID=2045200 RepID=A0ABN5JUV3_9PSED|nr:hypothetical protein CRX69_15005 [Pseudomonas rhizophila]